MFGAVRCVWGRSSVSDQNDVEGVVDALFCDAVELTPLYKALSFIRGRKFAILITNFAVKTKSMS